MKTIKDKIAEYLQLNMAEFNLRVSLQNQFESIINETVRGAKNRTELDDLLRFIETEIPRNIVLNKWYQLIHSKYVAL